jgi:hypothetical protein
MKLRKLLNKQCDATIYLGDLTETAQLAANAKLSELE